MVIYMGMYYHQQMAKTKFEWDAEKDALNQEKHGVSFAVAQYAFADLRRVIAKDDTHSQSEERFYCFGEVDGGVLTVRFTYRLNYSNYWRWLLAQRKGNL